MSSEHDPEANRRRFLQYLAASPLLAAGGAQALAETILPKTAKSRTRLPPWPAPGLRTCCVFISTPRG